MIMDEKLQLSLDHWVVQAEGQVVSDMDGEKVMLSISKGKYYNLGEIGGSIWEAIASPISIRKLVPILTDEYEVGQGECEEQLLSFLENLAEEQLIHIGREGKLQ